jgi:hypothetical protein
MARYLYDNLSSQVIGSNPSMDGIVPEVKQNKLA